MIDEGSRAPFKELGDRVSPAMLSSQYDRTFKE
jgi:hypothetical protein